MAALLNVLEILEAKVVRSLPRSEEASYIIIDLDRRSALVAQDNWVEAWYQARVELDTSGTLIGLVIEEGHNPVPGACQIPVLRVFPELIHLFDRLPRALSKAEVDHQKQPVRKRQAEIIEHDIKHLINMFDLGVDTAFATLNTTLSRITHPDLRSELSLLLQTIQQITEVSLLRETLRTALAKLRSNYEPKTRP